MLIRETCAWPAELGGAPDERVRHAVARAVAGGALGPGRVVRLAGEDIELWDAGGRRRRGVLRVGSGRVAGEVVLGEARRFAEGALWAGVAASLATVALGWPWWWALPSGTALGAGYVAARLRGDARAWRLGLRALAANLALLVGERGEHAGESRGVHP